MIFYAENYSQRQKFIITSLDAGWDISLPLGNRGGNFRETSEPLAVGEHGNRSGWGESESTKVGSLVDTEGRHSGDERPPECTVRGNLGDGDSFALTAISNVRKNANFRTRSFNLFFLSFFFLHYLFISSFFSTFPQSLRRAYTTSVCPLPVASLPAPTAGSSPLFASVARNRSADYGRADLFGSAEAEGETDLRAQNFHTIPSFSMICLFFRDAFD